MTYKHKNGQMDKHDEIPTARLYSRASLEVHLRMPWRVCWNVYVSIV